jgi:WD40 repeat protein
VLGEDATRGIQSIAFSPDNRFIAVVGGIFDKDVVVWDTATSEIVQQFQQPQAVSSEAKSPEETPFV